MLRWESLSLKEFAAMLLFWCLHSHVYGLQLRNQDPFSPVGQIEYRKILKTYQISLLMEMNPAVLPSKSQCLNSILLHDDVYFLPGFISRKEGLAKDVQLQATSQGKKRSR